MSRPDPAASSRQPDAFFPRAHSQVEGDQQFHPTEKLQRQLRVGSPRQMEKSFPGNRATASAQSDCSFNPTAVPA
jgi:hypothetical protein